MSTKKQRLKNPNIKIFIESSSYAEHNGEVVKDQYIREILDNNKMQVVEYDNGDGVFITVSNDFGETWEELEFIIYEQGLA